MPPTADLPKKRIWPRLGLLVLMAVAAALVYWQWSDDITFEALAAQEQTLREAYRSRPLFALAMAFAAYVVVCALALPGAATALTLLYGWLFGFWIAVPLVSFASTAGASLAFLLSRYLFRDLVEARFRSRIGTMRQAIDRDGAFYLLLARLSPLVPFYLINVVMGLTSLRLATFWWVSQLGMLPATCIYVYTGSAVPGLEHFAQQGIRGIVTLPLVIGLTLLGLFPLAMKKLAQRWSRSRKR